MIPNIIDIPIERNAARCMQRPKDLIYSVDEWPPAPKLAVLGLQQVSLVSIYLVLLVIVVREAGASPETARNTLSLAMIAMGVGAGLQAAWKGPIGSGFLAPPVLSAIYLQVSLAAAKAGGLPLVAGMTMVAGLFEALLSRFLHLLRRLFPPVVSGVIIAAVGFEVGLIGFKQFLCVVGTLCTRDLGFHLIVGALTLGTMMGLSVWGRGLFACSVPSWGCSSASPPRALPASSPPRPRPRWPRRLGSPSPGCPPWLMPLTPPC